MQIHNVQQGTQEWLDLRAKHFSASEAPIVMGFSRHTTRAELLRMRATGGEKEFSDFVQRQILDKGHENEAAARPIAEHMIGEELFPVVATHGKFLASTDGLTLDGRVGWESKSPNEVLNKALDADDLTPDVWWQVQQQLMVTGAERWLVTASDGTHENTRHVWIEPDHGAFDDLRKAWEQFENDLQNYTPTIVEPKPEGRAPKDLPALRINVTGAVTDSNLADFRRAAMQVFESINTDLQTDQDFADAEKTVKFCKTAEQRLDAAKDHALSQTASIDELFRTIDEIKAEARAKRLELEKLVKARKQAVRDEILMTARKALNDHVAALNERLLLVHIPPSYVVADFAGAMKNKRTIQSLHDAVDAELANAKIELNALADEAQKNLVTFQSIAQHHRALFPDLQQIACKPHDDFVSVVKCRIAEHAAEAERAKAAEAERAKQSEAPPLVSKVDADAQMAASVRNDVVHEDSVVVKSPATPRLRLRKVRPTNNEILQLIATHYGVDEATALSWLRGMNLDDGQIVRSGT